MDDQRQYPRRRLVLQVEVHEQPTEGVRVWALREEHLVARVGSPSVPRPRGVKSAAGTGRAGEEAYRKKSSRAKPVSSEANEESTSVGEPEVVSSSSVDRRSARWKDSNENLQPSRIHSVAILP